MHQRHRGARRHPGQCTDQRGTRRHPDGVRTQRAREHATLDAEIHHTGALADELAERGKQDGRAGVHAADQGLLDSVHARALAFRMLMASGAITMRPRSTSTTVPSRP